MVNGDGGVAGFIAVSQIQLVKALWLLSHRLIS